MRPYNIVADVVAVSVAKIVLLVVDVVVVVVLDDNGRDSLQKQA